MLQGLHRGRSVGRELRVGDSDHFHIAQFQVIELIDGCLGTRGNPHRQDAHGVRRAAARRQEIFPGQLVHVRRVRCKEDVERRRILDLGGELRGGTDAEERMDFVLRFEFRAECLTEFGQVGGGRDRDFRGRRRGELADNSPKR